MAALALALFRVLGPTSTFSADGNSPHPDRYEPHGLRRPVAGDPCKRTLAPEFAKSFDVAEENGLPVSIELNPRLSSTMVPPIDYKGLQATGTSTSTDGDYKVGQRLQQHCFRGSATVMTSLGEGKPLRTYYPLDYSSLALCTRLCWTRELQHWFR